MNIKLQKFLWFVAGVTATVGMVISAFSSNVIGFFAFLSVVFFVLAIRTGE